MAFPADPLDVKVALQIAGAWVDVTTDTLIRENERVDIGRGRPNEASQVDASSCALSLRNPDGKYSPRNPLGQYYGQLGRNTPTRVAIGSTVTPAFRSVASASANAATVTVTKPAGTAAGDTLVIFHSSNVDIADMSPPSGGPWMLLASENSGDGGTLYTNVWTKLAVTGEPASYTLGQSAGAYGVAAAAAVTGGVSAVAASQEGHTAGTDTFATPSVRPIDSDDFELRWVAGTRVAGVAVTWTPPAGFTERADLQSGTFTTGSLATRSLASMSATGVHTFTASSAALNYGHGFTVVFSSTDMRFCGEISSLPQRWDISEQDVWAPVQAAGLLRRLGQGAKPLRSPIRRAYAAAGVVAYWPLEDGGDSSQFASAITGHPAATFAGTSNLSSDDTHPGSEPLPTFTSLTGVVTATVPSVGLSAQWQVEFFVNIAAEPGGNRILCDVYTSGTGALWRVWLRSPSSGNIEVQVLDSASTVITTASRASTSFYGGWVHFSLFAQQSGGNVAWGFRWAPVVPGVLTTFATLGTVFAGTVGRPILVDLFAATFPMGIGHLGVFDTYDTTAHWVADNGHIGETAGRRFQRLCDEQDIPVRIVGDPYDSEPMGVQRIATFLDLLGDVQTTDGGIEFETRDEPGLTYRTRVSRYNQPTTLALTYGAAGEVSPPLEPDEDDQLIRNDITVKRRDGSSARAVLESGALSVQDPPDGAGRYDEAVTVDVATDGQLAALAEWLRHLGTVDEPRYPTVHVDMAALGQAGKTALMADVTRVDVGHRLTVASPPVWVPPDTIELHAQGYTESIGQYDWDLHFNCSPARPYVIATVEGAGTSTARVDADADPGSRPVLNGAHNSTTTSLSVTVPGNLWTTTATFPADFPFDIDVGGEKMTVTAISGTSSPQTMTVTRSVNGVVKSHSSGAAVSLWKPSVIGL